MKYSQYKKRQKGGLLLNKYRLRNLKKGGIFIKPENRGKFTEWCKRKGYNSVTKACVQEGLNSKDPLTRKRANFAKQFGKGNK